MHRALAIPDVVFAICGALVKNNGVVEDEGPFFVDKKTLAACARTCRAFHLPAVTMLWKHPFLTIETLLLHCTPENLWEKYEDVEDQVVKVNNLVLRRPVYKADLERFLFYAPFVNKLTFGAAADLMYWLSLNYPGGKGSKLSDDGYSALLAVLDPSAFVNLRHVVWNTSVARLHHLQSFLSPSIVSLELKLHQAPMSSLTLLSNLPVRCPNVHTFDITCTDRQAEAGIKTATAHLIQSWNLRCLDCDTLDLTSLTKLAHLPLLTRLAIKLTSRPPRRSALPDLPANCFGSLQCLELRKVHIGLCIELLQNARFAALIDLDLGVFTTIPANWSDLFRAIRHAHARPETLQCLQVTEDESSGHGNPPMTAPVIDGDLLHLLEFHGLKVMVIQAKGGVNVEPATTERIAKAFPRLQRLGLSAWARPRWERRLTLQALESFAIHCPKLDEIEIELDARSVSFEIRSPGASATLSSVPSGLSVLSVQWSPISSSRAAAAYLSTFFPKLNCVDSSDELLNRRWARVGRSIPVFARVRAHERMLAGNPSAAARAGLALDFSDLDLASGSEEEEEE
ncbi:uncharacterized protein SCHCODRAFT_02671272 [Schizophyllum commune H4-8]|nr:uncharacterized protein SCHCODRAFT_02671272 [Schizophyllum commune H4-8]KAI5888716.1 hypothetical protein SCHCODRAFT_02671272 [Schizophyllum commune H4-8]